MHELSIAQSIAEAVDAKAEQHHATCVKTVHLRVGEASGVLIESLSFCFGLLSDNDPLLKHAQLQIDVIPHRAWCRACDSEFVVYDFIVQCPLCEGWDTQVIAGTELQLQDIEIETAS
jgi:hydrogenase nickel incorporation protein HypA/HybF